MEGEVMSEESRRENESSPGPDSGEDAGSSSRHEESGVGHEPRPAEASADVEEAPDVQGTSSGDGTPDGEPDSLDARLDALREERDIWKDRHLRLAADFDNYRRRSETEMRQRWTRAQADLVAQLLEPLDDLLRIADWGPETKTSAEAVVEGAGLVERKFFRVLEEIGVEVVDPSGDPFDPNTMEAMMRVPAGSEEDDDVVERVFQKGYVLKGQLLRPARVSVYKAD